MQQIPAPNSTAFIPCAKRPNVHELGMPERLPTAAWLALAKPAQPWPTRYLAERSRGRRRIRCLDDSESEHDAADYVPSLRVAPFPYDSAKPRHSMLHLYWPLLGAPRRTPAPQPATWWWTIDRGWVADWQRDDAGGRCSTPGHCIGCRCPRSAGTRSRDYTSAGSRLCTRWCKTALDC